MRKTQLLEKQGRNKGQGKIYSECYEYFPISKSFKLLWQTKLANETLTPSNIIRLKATSPVMTTSPPDYELGTINYTELSHY